MRQVGSLNHSRWECKYHVVFIPKYRKKAIFGQIRSDLGEVLRTGGAEGEPDRGGSSDAGSRAHDDFDSAEACSIAGDWLHQRKERDPHSEEVCGKEAELRRAVLLGPRLLCLDGGTG